MRMRFNQNLILSSMEIEYLQDFPDVSPLFRPCIELAIRECACTPFPIAIVRVRIDNLLPVDGRNILFPVIYFFSPFQDNRFKPQSERFIRIREFLASIECRMILI